MGNRYRGRGGGEELVGGTVEADRATAAVHVPGVAREGVEVEGGVGEGGAGRAGGQEEEGEEEKGAAHGGRPVRGGKEEQGEAEEEQQAGSRFGDHRLDAAVDRPAEVGLEEGGAERGREVEGEGEEACLVAEVTAEGTGRRVKLRGEDAEVATGSAAQGGGSQVTEEERGATAVHDLHPGRGRDRVEGGEDRAGGGEAGEPGDEVKLAPGSEGQAEPLGRGDRRAQGEELARLAVGERPVEEEGGQRLGAGEGEEEGEEEEGGGEHGQPRLGCPSPSNNDAASGVPAVVLQWQRLGGSALPLS